MSKIELVTFEIEHALSIYKTCTEDHIRGMSEDSVVSVAEIWKSKGPSITAMHEGVPVGCAGVMFMWKGTGHAWILFDNDPVQSLKREAYTLVLQELAEMVKVMELRRVQATCRIDLPHAIKYLEQLGFTREGRLRKYDIAGNDHYIYSMIFED
jgi:RimJ/RimL family protein N-acetyltransferase